MKKSKFLKKSLAMLLALMLVVAMIPLSAAAADQPSLTYLYIGGSSVKVNGTTFEASVARYSKELNIRVAENALDYANGKTGTLELMKAGVSNGENIAGNDGSTTGTTITLADYGIDTATNGGTLNLRLMADGKKVADYTINLSVRDPHTTASLNESATDGTGTYEVKVNNGAHDIDLVVPTGALTANQNGTNGAHIRVQTQDNATIDTTNATNATVTDMKGGFYDIAVAKDGATITVISESGANKQAWTINVTEVDSLRTFSFGSYTGTVNTTDDEVTVTIPKKDGKDDMGYNVTFNLPVSFTTYGDTDKVYIGKQADGSDAVAYNVGTKLNVGALIANTNPKYAWEGYIWVDCKGYEKLQKYDLTIKLGEDNSTGITAAYFNDNKATIDGNEITANLPMRDEKNQNTDLDKVKVVLYTDTAAAVKSVTGFKREASSDIDGTDKWVVDSVDGTTSIRNGKQVVVTAEDGTTQTYNLSATIEQNTTDAKLTGIYITDGSYQAKGNIVGNTIFFEVPYLTINVNNWKIYATANSAANVVADRANYGTAKVVRSGITTMRELGFAGTLDTTVRTTAVNDGTNVQMAAISAVNMNDNDYFQDYNIVVNLATPVTNGTTLTKFQMSIQNDNPTTDGIAANGYDTNEKVTSRVNADNSVVAKASDGTITDAGKDQNNTGTIEIDTPYALRSAQGGLYRILTDIETVNGGVAFYVRKGAAAGSEWWSGYVLSDLPNNKDAFSGNLITQYSDGNEQWYVVVLPEDVARSVLTKTSTAGSIYFSAADGAKGTVYTLKEDVQDPHDYKIMYNISVNQANLKVEQTSNVTTNGTEVGEVTGALPWSYTVSKDEVATLDKNAGQFLTFGIDAYATLRFTDSVYPFYSAGDVDGDGETDEGNVLVTSAGRYSNPKLLFVRQDDGNVALYRYVNNNGGEWAPLTDNQLITVAEDGKSTMTYTFRLKWNPANTEAELKSFSIGNSTGVFNGNNISVVLPYGTDVKGLIPTFTTSEYAKVTLDSKTGDSVVSGKTSVNFSQTVRLVVTSEDGLKTNPYSVTVTLADAFSDVPSSAWYYSNVMQAAAAGIVSGRGDGTFAPLANVTRRDFAIMLTQMLGESNDGSAVSPFIDVDDDDYGVVAIAYCKAHNIISGYDDGTFKPDATITRQEAASMIANAMGVSKVSDEKYPDDSTIASWAKNAVYRAKAAGLMKGDAGTGNFRPTATITRAEAASIMVNALNQ